jgi:3'(2'), 5'-bisphosphate nucleotidase
LSAPPQAWSGAAPAPTTDEAFADPELDALLVIAREAAALIMRVHAEGFAVELKGPNDPVTRADREANALICARLAEQFPDAAILAEESVPAERQVIAARVAERRVLFVDPLDGTREFADRRDDFAVMIGLAEGGRARLGVVVMPVTGLGLAGRVGEGGLAFREGPDGARAALHPSSVTDPGQATMVVSRSHRPTVADRVRGRLGIARELACGSVGIKVAKVALAEADLYVHGGAGCKRWDTCAPEAILRAAGGAFTDLDGELLDYADPDLAVKRGICASNGHLHAAVLAAARPEG